MKTKCSLLLSQKVIMRALYDILQNIELINQSPNRFMKLNQNDYPKLKELNRFKWKPEKFLESIRLLQFETMESDLIMYVCKNKFNELYRNRNERKVL